MVRVRSDIPQKAEQYLQETFSQAEAAVRRAMVKTSLVGESRVKGIMEREAYDTGRLLRSVTSEIKRMPNEIRLIIGSNLEYAPMVEHGRKPGSGHGKNFPNLNALVKWTGRKLRQQGISARVNITFDQLKEMAKTKKKSGEASSQAKIARKHLSFVYLVGRKIATKGIREKHIFKRIEEGLLAYFRAEALKELNSI